MSKCMRFMTSRVKFEDVGCLVGYSMLPTGRLDDEDVGFQIRNDQHPHA